MDAPCCFCVKLTWGVSLDMAFSFTQFQAAIVDLDGTMVDTMGDFEVALNRALHDLDLPPVTRA